MLSDLQKKKVMHLFDVLDVNKNGKLQLDDFVHVAEAIIKQLGIRPNSRAARLVMIKANRLFVQFLIDTNQPDLQIGIYDWMKFFERELEKSTKSGLVYHFVHRTNFHLFALFDLNGDNHISLEEYTNMWGIYKLNHVDCKTSFKGLDKNGDDLISVDEMIAALDDFFYSDDPRTAGNNIFGMWA